AASGELKGSPGHYVLALQTGRLGATDLAGELSWTRGDERDVVRAKLTSESASLADLRALAGKRPAQAVDAVAARAARPDPPRVRPVDSELSFVARRLHGDGMPWLKGGRIDAALADGHLKVSHFEVGIGEGRASGKAAVDTRSQPLHADAEIDVSAI